MCEIAHEHVSKISPWGITTGKLITNVLTRATFSFSYPHSLFAISFVKLWLLLCIHLRFGCNNHGLYSDTVCPVCEQALKAMQTKNLYINSWLLLFLPTIFTCINLVYITLNRCAIVFRSSSFFWTSNTRQNFSRINNITNSNSS